MKLAGGVLGMCEADFWASSFTWFRAAAEGCCEFHGASDNKLDEDDIDRIERAREQARREGLI